MICSAISLVDVLDRFEHALAAVAGLVAVAQFDGLVSARGGPGRYSGTSRRAAQQSHLYLKGGIAPRVEYLVSVDILYLHDMHDLPSALYNRLLRHAGMIPHW